MAPVRDLRFANWLVASKTAPVNQPTFLIPRRGLDLLQSASVLKTVTLLEAPGGYGKSTALTQWREKLVADNHTVGWLFLDEDDNNLAVLVTYIIFALSKGGLPVTPELNELIDALPHQQPRASLGILLNIIAEAGRKVLLILDDFEALNEDAVEAVVIPLIRLAPENFHLLIATRKHARLNLPQLYAQGRLQKIGPVELRFSLPEIEEVFGGQLNKTEIAQVEEVTQGWPVALQLLRSWINQDPRRVSEIKRITGLTDDIVEYVSDEIIRAFPETIHTLLMEAAVLQYFSEQDLREICGSHINWSELINCEPLRPFLLPHEGVNGEHRLHPILKEYLSRSLEQRSPERKRELHERATWLYARTDRLLPAIRQADQSGDPELEVKVIEDAGGVQIWLRHGLAITRSISRMLSQDLLDLHPRLALLRALVLAKEGRVADARALFHRVAEKSAGFTLDGHGADSTALRRDGLMVESTLLVNDCRAPSEAYLTNYENLVAEAYDESEFYAGHVKTFLSLCHHQRGRFDEARRYSIEALSHYTNERVWHGVVFVHLHLGVIAFANGKPEAATHYLAARSVAQQYFASDRSKSLLVDVLLAELYYERNQLTVARRTAANTLGRLNTTEAWMDVYAAACLTTASLAYEDRGAGGALDTISQARQDAAQRGVSGLQVFLQAAELLFLSRAVLLERAEEVFLAINAPQIALHSTNDSDSTWREQELVLLARAAFALRAGCVQEVVGELAEAARGFLSSGNVRSYIRVGAMSACALHASDLVPASFSVLSDVLAHCRETGYVRIFHEEHELFSELLRDFSSSSFWTEMPESSRAYAKNLIAELSKRMQPASAELTIRELEVLQHLKEGYQDKVIARNLTLTENTVKYHLKSIFRKLHVTSRTEAVREAQRQSL